MKTKDTLSEQEKQLFKDTIGAVKPMVQDTIHWVKKTSKSNLFLDKKNHSNSSDNSHAEFHFSDQYRAHFNENEPLSYVREDISKYEAKNLKRGFYNPDLILDLHGLTVAQSKREIAALLHACQREHAECLCIIHGLGSRTLKQTVPHWLVQHPDVKAFHQATKKWGGNGAILVLMEIHDKTSPTQL